MNFTLEGMEDPNPADEVQQPFPYGKRKPHSDFDEMSKRLEEVTEQTAEVDRIKHEKDVQEKDKKEEDVQEETKEC